MKKEKGIDDIFKHGLGDPVDETAFRESDWDSLENMLDKDKRRGKVFWLPILSSAAALLLVFFGWWMFRSKPVNTQQNTQQVANNSITKKTMHDTAAQHAQPQVAATHQPEKTGTIVSKSPNTTADDKTFTQHNKVQTGIIANRVNKSNDKGDLTASTGTKPATNTPFTGRQNTSDTARNYVALTAVSLSPAFGQTNTTAVPVIASAQVTPNRSIDASVLSSRPVIKKTGAGGLRPQYTLSAFAASEANGVGTFQSTSAGTNVGLMFSAGVKRFTLSTGVNYSAKPYTLPFDQYHTAYKFKNDPQYVTADCRVLDIPINVGYQLYNKSRNKISVGTGLSSYIMMHESYTYDYGSSSTVYGPSYYAVKGKGKYLFSIMNIQASYERQVNSKVGISLQPYLKVPLSNIGYSQVKVQTYGVAVGLNWNINSLTKPK